MSLAALLLQGRLTICHECRSFSEAPSSSVASAAKIKALPTGITSWELNVLRAGLPCTTEKTEILGVGSALEAPFIVIAVIIVATITPQSAAIEPKFSRQKGLCPPDVAKGLLVSLRLVNGISKLLIA